MGFLAGVLLSFALAAPVFRLNLPAEPTNLDPHLQRSAASSYMMQNLHRGLFVEDAEAGLRPELAEGCARSKNDMVLTCRLKKNLKWSDGTPLTAKDFLAGYQRLLNPATGAYRAELLFPVRGAQAIFEGRAKPSALGISAPDDSTLRFEFETPDGEFEHSLANSVLAPHRPGAAAPTAMTVTGPYRIVKWDKGRRVRLEKNPHYPGGFADRPPVEMSFVSEDSTALKLYEKNELDFLRRLPTAYIPRFKDSAEFHFLPMARFDYIGFGPRLLGRPRLREALARSLDFAQMQSLFHSIGRPGCPGISADWLGGQKPGCIEFDPKRAKEMLEGEEIPPGLTYLFSSLAGEDSKRAAEWQQRQWKKILGLDVRLQMKENKVFLSMLVTDPPDLFRKGIAADRPTCASLLQRFEAGHPEDYLKITAPEFVGPLRTTRNGKSAQEREAACRKAIDYLVKNVLLIPLGPMHFAVLAKPGFTGWKLNQLNQLDLANLRAVPDAGVGAKPEASK